MHRLRNKAEAEGGRLLRVLLLRLGALSANSGGTLRRIGRGLLLRVAYALERLRCTSEDNSQGVQNIRMSSELAT